MELKPTPLDSDEEEYSTKSVLRLDRILYLIIFTLILSVVFGIYMYEKSINEKEVKKYLLNSNKDIFLKVAANNDKEAIYLDGVSLFGKYSYGREFNGYYAKVYGNEVKFKDVESGKCFLKAKYDDSKLYYFDIEDKEIISTILNKDNEIKLKFLIKYFTCFEYMDIQCISDKWNEVPLMSGKNKPRSKESMMESIKYSFAKRKKSIVTVTNAYNFTNKSVDINLKSEITSIDEEIPHVNIENYQVVLDDNGLIIKLIYK